MFEIYVDYMADYVIKSFEKGFEKMQEKVGYQVAKTWIYAHQTPANRLKELYSQPDFDPETRHYCFKGNKLVGFLTTKVVNQDETNEKKATLVFPSVLSGHEEVGELLHEKALSVLKEKGIKKVETFASSLCGNQIEKANKYGYTFVKDADNIVFTLKQENIRSIYGTEGVNSLDKEKDLEKWIETVSKLDNLNEERIKQLKIDISNDENIMDIIVIKDGDEIVGTSLLYRNPIKPNSANLAMTYVTETKYLQMLAEKAGEIGKEQGIDYYLSFLQGNRLNLRKHYAELDFNYAQPFGSIFEKEI